jgi:2-polyprenyl-3-methyl-5-hydroxy-6-metoxy-1,4-benzoquinol methylase
MSLFSQRSREKEIMDDLDCSGPVLEQTLRELKTINRWLGGNEVTNRGLNEVVSRFPQAAYSLVDLGCGGGDMLAVMQGWAQQKGLTLELTGTDANANIIDLAKERQRHLPELSWQVANVFDPNFLEEQVDIATCTLFTHHFTDQELVQLFQGLKKKVRLAIVINDLHRHPLAYYSIKWLTGWFSKSPMVQHDAALSVLRSFKRNDWASILQQAGLPEYSIRWRWAFRWQLCVYV